VKVAALGAGRMGRGIGHVFAWAGFEVDVIDFKPRADPGRAAKEALAEIRGNLALLAQLGLAEDVERVLKRIRIVANEEAPASLRAADVVFEGVTETEEAKRDALMRACKHLRPDAIIASTTSSMLADKLAAMVTHPERFLNAHFLNPAYLIPLVEVSPARSTAESVFLETKKMLEAAGKVVVRCSPSPGFIVPRLQAAVMNEAVRLVEEGVATPEEIDRAVRSGFGPRYTAMGVCEFIDYGGLDILFYASSSMQKALNAPRYAPPALVKKLMEEGKRGTREGEGLYDWRGRDLPAYQRDLVGRYVALFQHLGLLKPAV
jgi:3-hydroxybutyryl-CoA dehydrogenase